MSIAPTLTPSEAAGRFWDVIVIGAGPAGALAARQVARLGPSVLLVDKAAFPRWKVCGSCLNVRVLTTLASAGLGDLVERHGGVPLDRFHLAAAGRRATVPLPGGVALSRERFDAALVNSAIEAGVAFLPQTQAGLGGLSRTSRLVTLRQDDDPVESHARVVLIANGLGSRLLAGEEDFATPIQDGSKIGAGTIVDKPPTTYGPGTIFMACGRSGYVGVVQLEDGRLDVGAAFDPDGIKRAGSLGALAEQIVGEAGLPAIPGLADLTWRGTPLLTRRVSKLACERAFVLGDAAGYIEPFTGEGISWAVAGGMAVAPLAQRAAKQWEPALARRWSVLYRQLVSRRQRACRAVAGVLRRPGLTRILVGVLSRAPVVAAPLIHYLNWPSSTRRVTA